MAVPALLASLASYLAPQAVNFAGNAVGSYFANKSNQPPQMPGKKGKNKNALQGNTLDQQGDWFNGFPGQQFQFPTLRPQQFALQDFLINQGMQNSNFGDIENRELRRFNTETVPGLAERFTALGSGGSQRSSAFQGALGQAGSDLGERLGALRSQYGLAQSQLALQPSFENVYLPGQPGAAGQLAGQSIEAILPLIGQWLQNSGWFSGKQKQQMNPAQMRQYNIDNNGYVPLQPPTPSNPKPAPQPLPKLAGLK